MTISLTSEKRSIKKARSMDFDGQGGRGVGQGGKGERSCCWRFERLGEKAEGGVGNESVRAEIGAKRRETQEGDDSRTDRFRETAGRVLGFARGFKGKGGRNPLWLFSLSAAASTF